MIDVIKFYFTLATYTIRHAYTNMVFPDSGDVTFQTSSV